MKIAFPRPGNAGPNAGPGDGIVKPGLAAAVSLALLPLLPACTAPDHPSPPTIRRDSAGIAIVESFRPAWGDSARWRIHPEPLLDLARSGDVPEHLFHGVDGMARLSDGTIVVANRGSQEIRWFSPGGRLIGEVGGHGEGPGEFDNLQQIEMAGDTVLALDFDETVALFAPGPRLVRVLRMRHFSHAVHFLGGGTLVVPTLLTWSETHGQIRDPEALLLYDLQGTLGDSIGQIAGAEEYVAEALSGRPLFPKRSVVDTHGGHLFTGSADFMQVEVLSAVGDTIRILRIPGYPLDLTEAQVEAEREARLNVPLPLGMTLPPPLRQAIEDMPSPTTRPAYDRMIVDPTGAVWLRHFVAESEREGIGESGEPGSSALPDASALRSRIGLPDESVRSDETGRPGATRRPEAWLVFAASGEWLGDVELAPGFRILNIGSDEILGVRSDEMDVEHPQILRLTREGG